MGWRVRQNLLGKTDCFRDPAMMTLTVDRKRFSSPQEAHRVVTEKSYIPRLMNRLGVKTWFWVLEFQTKSGTGWPHWHLLIDKADACDAKGISGRVDLDRAWALWRDKWGIGGVDLSKSRSFASRDHAVFYVTKYLTKMPEAFPVWVIKSAKTVRFIGGCKALGSLTGQPSRPAMTTGEAERELRVERGCRDLETLETAFWNRARVTHPKRGGSDAEFNRTLKAFRLLSGKPLPGGFQPDLPFPAQLAKRTALVVRMSRCGMTASVFCVDGNCETGEGEWTYVGSVQATPDDLVELAEQGLVSLRVASVDWGESELWAVTDRSIGGLIAALRKLPGELADRELAYSDEWLDRVEFRECMMLLAHERFWQRAA